MVMASTMFLAAVVSGLCLCKCRHYRKGAVVPATTASNNGATQLILKYLV